MAALPNAEPINGVASTAMNGHAAPRVSDLDGKAPAPSDWANYFCTYAFLYHQVLLSCLLESSSFWRNYWPSLGALKWATNSEQRACLVNATRQGCKTCAGLLHRRGHTSNSADVG